MGTDDSFIKAFFAGPQAENQEWTTQTIREVFDHWAEWRRSLFPHDGAVLDATDKQTEWYRQTVSQFENAIAELKALYTEESPTFSPRYIGHMQSEVSLPALIGHVIGLLHNPNLTSTTDFQVASHIEAEAIAALRAMIGYAPAASTGHFTSGGTIANFEGLWRARFRIDHWLALGTYARLYKHSQSSLFESAHMGWDTYHALLAQTGTHEDDHRPYSFVANNPWKAAQFYRQAFGNDFLGPVVLVPGNKHFSWNKAVSVLGFGDNAFWTVELDDHGRLCIHDLHNKIKMARSLDRPIAAVVSVAGTTELGEIDPIHKVQTLLDRLRDEQNIHIWHHVDAAYGGYFCSLLDTHDHSDDLTETNRQSLAAIKRAHSVSIDPHKLGYVPYSCGAILLREPRCNQVSSYNAPYLSKQAEQEAWTTTLEGSRPATGASAVWLTEQTLGHNNQGLGKVLQKGIAAATQLQELLCTAPHCHVVTPIDTNVVCCCFAKHGEALSATNVRTHAVFQAIKESEHFIISKTTLDCENYQQLTQRFTDEWNGAVDAPNIFLLRFVLMNPFLVSTRTNIDYLRNFVATLSQAVAQHP